MGRSQKRYRKKAAHQHLRPDCRLCEIAFVFAIVKAAHVSTEQNQSIFLQDKLQDRKVRAKKGRPAQKASPNVLKGYTLQGGENEGELLEPGSEQAEGLSSIGHNILEQPKKEKKENHDAAHDADHESEGRCLDTSHSERLPLKPAWVPCTAGFMNVAALSFLFPYECSF